MNELSTYAANHNPRLRERVQQLFKRMHEIFGKKFTDQWRMLDEKKMIDNWCAGLIGYRPSEINRGELEMDKLSWPPLLEEFKRLCRPAENATVAYYEALNGLNARVKGEQFFWSHPAVFWAAATLAHDLQTQTYSSVRARWEFELKQQFEKNQWPEIPEPERPALTYNKSTNSRERARSFVRWAQNFLSAKKNAQA